MNRKETITLLETSDWSPKFRKEMVCRLYELMDRREFVKALRERYTDDEIEILVNTFRTKNEGKNERKMLVRSHKESTQPRCRDRAGIHFK